jgi:pimeloyl-ACP methyl ester carboxylesterase
LVVSLIPLTWHTSTDPVAAERPLIVFVHSYGGNNHTTHRFAQMLLEFGYSSVSFTLPFNGTPTHFIKPWNVIEGWAKEIDRVLNQVGLGRKKIIYSFSGPGASTLHGIAFRFSQNKFDVTALIFDSGPFVDARECTRNLVKDFYGVKNPILRELRLAYLMLVWGSNHNERLKQSLKTIAQIRPRLPILSIRGRLDKLVPIDKIQKVFEGFPFPNLEIANFENDHLTSLRDHPEEYKKIVKKFLERLET